MSLAGRWVFGIVSGLISAISIYLRMEALAIAAVAALGISVLPSELFQSLAGRLRRAGPFEFEAVIRRAVEAVPESRRARAEQEARETIERLGRGMANLGKFANLVRAELAVLSVRTAALEEEADVLRERLSRQPPPPSTGNC